MVQLLLFPAISPKSLDRTRAKRLIESHLTEYDRQISLKHKNGAELIIEIVDRLVKRNCLETWYEKKTRNSF